MTTKMIELQRNNVTVADFLNYIKWECVKKGLDFSLSRDEFENPPTEYSTGYTVIDGKKKGRYSEYREITNYRRKIESYQTSEGYTRFYQSNEFEEYTERKLHSWSDEWDAEDAPCKAETVRQFAYDNQTYILNFDGSCYNEICEFTFDSENRGHGYYY